MYAHFQISGLIALLSFLAACSGSYSTESNSRTLAHLGANDNFTTNQVKNNSVQTENANDKKVSSSQNRSKTTSKIESIESSSTSDEIDRAVNPGRVSGGHLTAQSGVFLCEDKQTAIGPSFAQSILNCRIKTKSAAGILEDVKSVTPGLEIEWIPPSTTFKGTAIGCNFSNQSLQMTCDVVTNFSSEGEVEEEEKNEVFEDTISIGIDVSVNFQTPEVRRNVRELIRIQQQQQQQQSEQQQQGIQDQQIQNQQQQKQQP